jgi:hypothetical protein
MCLMLSDGYGMDDRGVGVRAPLGSRTSSSPCLPDRFSVLASFQMGTEDKAVGALQLVPRSRKCGSLHLFSLTSSWHGV